MTARLSLARLPTPLTRLTRLSEHLGVEVWTKRDDLTGLGLSGNKVRKLELLLAEATAQGAQVLLTTGGIQSNHCRATAVAARMLGLEVHLLLRGSPGGPPESNLLLDTLLGAQISWCSDDDYRDRRDELLAELAADHAAKGRTPYVIPEGGSNGLGSLGYVEAAAELATQSPPDFERVYVAVGSGGTVAGLAIAGLPVTGIAVCDDAATFTARVHEIAGEVSRLGGPALPRGGWHIDEDFRGPAYGVATPEVWEVIGLLARTEGLFLDPVYTGKAMHALVTHARRGALKGPVLFWHTGGAFGLFGRGH